MAAPYPNHIIHLRRNRELAFQLSRNRQLALCAACMKAI
jgi:hypothetical protein